MRYKLNLLFRDYTLSTYYFSSLKDVNIFLQSLYIEHYYSIVLYKRIKGDYIFFAETPILSTYYIDCSKNFKVKRINYGKY